MTGAVTVTGAAPSRAKPRSGKSDAILKIAIMAVGGQGGGVLTNWIEALARAQGYACQATSVAGVAQRTGATIYYIEMTPAGAVDPVFSLAPSAADVDIVIAAEMMEAGRAIMRGFVTPDRTLLIASTHRYLSVSEKTVPGDGTADSEEVRAAAEVASQKLIMFDLERIAITNNSVISACLFGALAASGRLPFERAGFEAAIRAGGKGVEASLGAFSVAFDKASTTPKETVAAQTAQRPGPREIAGPAKVQKAWQALLGRVEHLPAEVQPMARLGLEKVVDFQGVAYGSTYLDYLGGVLAQDQAAQGYELTRQAAKHIANAMAYDDLIKVADLKTRATRQHRINVEMAVTPDQHLRVTEYFHPRVDEVIGLMPVRLGARIEANPAMLARIKRWFARGRHLRSDRLGGFVLLFVLGGLRGWRLRTLRHAREVAHLNAWLEHALGHSAGDYALAVELLRCRRLIKGYSDTHSRGLANFDRVCGAAALLAGRDDAADWIRRLREAALQDEAGEALDGALQTIGSFTDAEV